MVQDPECFICGEANPQLIEEHHIVPRRYGGSDDPENLVALCSSCHTAVERIYNDSFYARLGLRSSQFQHEVAVGEIEGAEIKTIDAFDRQFWTNTDHIQYEQAAATVRIPADLGSDEGWVFYTDGSAHNPRSERESPDETVEHEGEVVGDEDDWDYDYRVQHIRSNRYGNSVGWLTSVPNLSNIIDERKDEILDEMRFDVPCKMVIAPDDPQIEPLLILINNKWDEKIGTDDYTHYKRIHCSYCNQVFAPFEHAAAARHLRLVHHITDVYDDQPRRSPSDDLLSGR